MHKISVMVFAALVATSVGCVKESPETAQNMNVVSEPARTEKSQTVTAHTTENQPQKVPSNSASSAPYKAAATGEPIDTAKFDGTIAVAEKVVKSKPSDEAAKKTLADAYFDRGFALTEARQYASALGDYRRALKLDPNHEESKKWIDQITSIYKMLKRDTPKEGEEPPPLKSVPPA